MKWKTALCVLAVMFVIGVQGCSGSDPVMGRGGDAVDTPNFTGNAACTRDARRCPDGSYLGRVAPHCQFAPCSR